MPRDELGHVELGSYVCLYVKRHVELSWRMWKHVGLGTCVGLYVCKGTCGGIPSYPRMSSVGAGVCLYIHGRGGNLLGCLRQSGA